MNSAGIKVFAPASIANLCIGYDVLGLALEKPGDEIIAKIVDKPGVHISAIHGDNGKLPLNPYKNTASYTAIKLLEHLGESKIGISLEIFKKMPFGSGLGSSAASSVAGVVAANALLGSPLTRKELLPFAIHGEALADGSFHADNVAPSLLGGIVLIRSNYDLDVVNLPVPDGLYISLIYPKIQILTADARNILSDKITLKQHVKQSGNLAAFISSLYTMNFDLMKNCLEDAIIEPQRAALIPHFYDVKNAALENNALGCSISGAGPSIFALCSNSLIAENVGNAMQNTFQRQGIDSELFLSKVNKKGSFIY